jgi:hypothetical protein
MEFNLENIQTNLKIKYYNNLVFACNKSSIKCDKINNLLNNLTTVQNEEIDVTVTANETVVSENTDYLYLKPWTKLNVIHKIIKIKEFVNSLNIKDKKEEDILKEKIIEIIKDKILSKKNKINYDSTKGNIISISCLSFNNDKFEII